MGEKKEKKEISANIEEILHERERLDQILKEKFNKEVVVLFTDICGYTSYIDTHGDICGRALIQKHNEIVIPIIEKHNGIVIKTIGDAVMASFSNSMEAVKASADIHSGLYEYNNKTEEVNRIFVKIGINRGEALVDEVDIYGDVVNVASRIQSHAKSYQILISKSVYEQIKGIEDILCRFHGNVKVKGKAKPLELYQVIWRDEDIVTNTRPIVRAYERAEGKKSEEQTKVFRLEVARVNDHLKISANEHILGEESTIRHYEEIPISMDWIDKKCNKIVNSLNKAIREDHFNRNMLIHLRETGQIFYRELFTPSVKKKFQETVAQYLCLYIDDQLVHIPWELLHDGQQFLCQRFNMGRLVKTKQTIWCNKYRALGRPLRMLIIATSVDDLNAAHMEALKIKEDFAKNSIINITYHEGDVTPAFLKEKMKYFDILHFAGHTEYNQNDPAKSGWKLTKGLITGDDIIKLPDSSTMPSLIFSNACQSARTIEWVLKDHFHDEIFGMANAFLLKGVKHYIGTFWEITDEPSSRFALEFYKHFLKGISCGEAIKKARLSLIKEYGEEAIVWASYILYGDPTSNYIDQIKADEIKKNDEEYSAGSCSMGAMRSQDSQEDILKEDIPEKKPKMFSIEVIGIIFVIILFLFFTIWNGKEKQIEEKNLKNFQIPQESILNQSSSSKADTDFQKTMQIIYLLSSYQDTITEHFKEKGFIENKNELDTWTSKPISICIILPDWEKVQSDTKEFHDSLEPHYKRLFEKLTENFTNTKSLGLSILERDRLVLIFQELQIGIPKLSIESLKGAYNILSAQAILFPKTFVYKTDMGIESEVSLRIVETKTSKIIAAFSSAFTIETESIQKTVAELTNKTIENLQHQYPLRGKIISFDDDIVKINLGDTLGVSLNQSFTVLGKTINSIPKGTIQVQSINEKTAFAKILNQNESFKSGDLIKAIYK